MDKNQAVESAIKKLRTELLGKMGNSTNLFMLSLEKIAPAISINSYMNQVQVNIHNLDVSLCELDEVIQEFTSNGCTQTIEYTIRGVEGYGVQRNLLTTKLSINKIENIDLIVNRFIYLVKKNHLCDLVA